MLQVRSIAIVGLLFMSLAFSYAALPMPASTPVAEEPALCHHDTSTRLPAGPHHSSHACCMVGHDRALASASVTISAPLPVSLAKVIPYGVEVSSEQHRLPEFNDSGPPDLKPLRI